MNWNILKDIKGGSIISNLQDIYDTDTPHFDRVKALFTELELKAEWLKIPEEVSIIGIFENYLYRTSEENDEGYYAIKHCYIFQVTSPESWEKVIRKMKQNLIVQLLSCINFENLYDSIKGFKPLEVRIEAIPSDESLIVVVVEFTDENL